MIDSPRSVPAPHRKRLVSPVAALAALMVLAAVLASGCGNASRAAGTSHACADKVAQATTTTAPVAGLWDCLTPDFQRKLDEIGVGTKHDSVLSIGVATSYTFLGASPDFATYEIAISPQFQQQAGGVKTAEITVWLATGGLVDNVGVGAQAF